LNILLYFGQVHPVRETTMRHGNFRYDGNGTVLENGVEYTIFETDDGIEAYPEGEREAIVMNKGTFVTLRNGKLEKTEGATPMA